MEFRRMSAAGRRIAATTVVAALCLSASGTATAQSPAPSGAPESAAPASPPALLLPNIDLSQVGGPGEGQLNLINWGGYAESGSNLAEYDWVNPFTAATGCVVNSKPDPTSDQMVTDMRQG